MHILRYNYFYLLVIVRIIVLQRRGRRRKKKSGFFNLIESSAPAKVPSILKTPETDRGDQQLSPAYRDIAQLPIAEKLQPLKVG